MLRGKALRDNMVSGYRRSIKRIISANCLHNEANPFRNQKVPDAEYAFTFHNGVWTLSNKTRISNYGWDSIIVILESPHVDEFNSANRLPLVKDESFINIFASAFTKSTTLKKLNVTLNQSTFYKVYLINAIQLQCSLGMPTQYYRDYVFCYYWERLKTDFENRLKTIIKNSKSVLAVVNLCTKGSHGKCTKLYNCSTKQTDKMYKKCGRKFLNKLMGQQNIYNSLSDMVDRSIVKVCGNLPKTTGKHPSSWKYARNCIK